MRFVFWALLGVSVWCVCNAACGMVSPWRGGDGHTRQEETRQRGVHVFLYLGGRRSSKNVSEPAAVKN